MLRWSSMSSSVLLNAFTTRSCTVWQAAHPPVLHVFGRWERMGRGGRTMTREKGGGQGRKSEREKTTAKNKNQMHKSQWRDLMKPRFRYLFFFLYAKPRSSFNYSSCLLLYKQYPLARQCRKTVKVLKEH